MAGKKHIITASAGLLVMLIAAVFILSGCTGSNSTTQGNAVKTGAAAAGPSNNAGSQPQAQPQNGPTGNFKPGSRPPGGAPLQPGDDFASSPLAKYAYDISDSATSAAEKQALSGFTVEKSTLADGSVNITLSATKSTYHTQSFIVKSGETLYFIEMSLGDDSNDNDYRYMDDIGVLVDANGKVVSTGN